MENIFISVIIPVYNVEKYIDECIQSITNQTLKNIEIILVDDESQDNCPRICDNYALQDTRIKVIHKKNEGLGFARNSGLEIAKGEYIAFIDSDDFIDLNTYELLYQKAIKENLDSIYFAYKNLSPDGNISNNNQTLSFQQLTTPLSIKDFILDMIGSKPAEKKDRKFQMSSCCAIYKKSIIDKYNIRFHSERELISEDLIFNIDFLHHSTRIALTPHTFYYYRTNPLSLTRTVRFDRVTKNIDLYLYLKEKIKAINLGKDAQYRNIRLLIGYTRSSILHVCKANISTKDKRIWLKEICNMNIWKEIANIYPYQKLPLKYRIFFYCTVKKYINILLFISKL